MALASWSTCIQYSSGIVPRKFRGTVCASSLSTSSIVCAVTCELKIRGVGGVGDVDHHAKTVHFLDHGFSVIVDPAPGIHVVAGIDERVGGVVRGQLHGAQAQPVQGAQKV